MWQRTKRAPKRQELITAYYTERDSGADMQFPSRVHYIRDTYTCQSICELFSHLVPANNPLLFAGGCKFGQGHTVSSVSLVWTAIMLLYECTYPHIQNDV